MLCARFPRRSPRSPTEVVARVPAPASSNATGWANPSLGYVVDIGINAFLAVEDAAIHPLSESGRLALVGQELEFDILRIDEAIMQVDLSRRALLERRAKS